jgi:hypothetical protein
MTTKSPVGEKTEMELLKEQIEALTKLVMQSQSASQQEKSEPKPKKERAVRIAKQEKSNDIAPNEYVNVMSLVPNPLNLSTKPRGTGKIFRFEKFGTIKRMFYSELLDVIENHPNFFEGGLFYILDSKVIELNNWNDLYGTILTKDKMESVLNNAPNALQVFEGANDKQRDIIIKFFVEKIVNGQPVDFNLIANINRIGNVDVQKLAEEMKQVNSNMTTPTQAK